MLNETVNQTIVTENVSSINSYIWFLIIWFLPITLFMLTLLLQSFLNFFHTYCPCGNPDRNTTEDMAAVYVLVV